MTFEFITRGAAIVEDWECIELRMSGRATIYDTHESDGHAHAYAYDHRHEYVHDMTSNHSRSVNGPDREHVLVMHAAASALRARADVVCP